MYIQYEKDGDDTIIIFEGDLNNQGSPQVSDELVLDPDQEFGDDDENPRIEFEGK